MMATLWSLVPQTQLTWVVELLLDSGGFCSPRGPTLLEVEVLRKVYTRQRRRARYISW
ncbi:hypothetical protein M404DRAFT_643821 [Pisolithus tinctorius Marx 270]|uniref:Uncharacterized protein n=1 Tax=Pisolithus tinctorius Marx 270 TaxID=870435 RepID=A0A0C3P5Z8_PISTI|nr:hypothetical protein M404DRAFT_643821 [Pisolithus tinctorius Marx 270]